MGAYEMPPEKRTRRKVNLTASADIVRRIRTHAGARGLSYLTEALWLNYCNAAEMEKSCNPVENGEIKKP